MLSRRAVPLLLVFFGLVGCANNDAVSSASAPSSIAPSATPSGPETISGTVQAGVEPNCLLLQDSEGSHLLVFKDPALRSDVTVGAEVTLTGRSEPRQMSTCQQGVPFVVSSVRRG